MGVLGLSAQTCMLSQQVAGMGSFTNVAELGDFNGPALTRNEIELTTHNDVEETFTVGIRRKTTLEAELNFVPGSTSHKALRDSWRNGDRDVWRVDFPDGAAWLFSGYVTNLGAQMPVDDKLTADLTVRPTGPMQFIDV